MVVGIFSAIVMDLPWIFDLHDFHRESTHYLAFAVLMAVAMLVYSRELIVAGVVFSNMFVHLMLDAIATRSTIVWLHPFSDWAFGYTGPKYMFHYLQLNLIVTLVPIVFISMFYLFKKESPLRVVTYLKKRYLVRSVDNEV